MLTIHGRTRCQFYKGRADWAAIRQVVDAVEVPVLANGDIVDGATAAAALTASGAVGVMVGRGAIGKPWLLAEIAASLRGQCLDLRPRGAAFADLVASHVRAQLDFYGPDVGVRSMRKHLDAYLGQVPGTDDLRQRLIRETDAARIFAGVEELGARDAADGRMAA